jgi:hypothetical protein
MANQSFFRLNLDEVSPEYNNDPTQIPNQLIRIDRARGDCCGCCGGACIRICRGTGNTGGARLWAGLVLLALALAAVVLLILVLWGIEFDAEGSSDLASGEQL